MKRFISLILVITMMIGSAFCLSGCAVKAEDAVKMGQWVRLIATSFGMQNYVEKEPYFAKVANSDPAFAAFQMAAEWDVLAPSDTIASDTPVTWKDAMVTLVNAGGFLSSDATEEEKIDFAIENFDEGIRKYWEDRYIKLAEAVELMDVAQDKWARMDITDKVEKATFTEEVKNYIDDKDIKYTNENGTIKIAASEIEGLKKGDVYALPSNGADSATVNKVKDIKYKDGYAYIINGEMSDEELAKVSENVVVRETTPVNFNQVLGIYDEAGNPINFTQSGNSNEGMSSGLNAPVVQNLSASYGSNNVQNLGLFDAAKGSLNFEVGGFKVELSLSGDSCGVELKKESNKKDNQTRDCKVTKYVGVTFNHVELTKDIDISWGKVKSALVKIDYETAIETGIKYTENNKVGKQNGDGSEVKSSLKSIINGYGNALKNISKDVRNTKYNNDSVYICRLSVASGGFASVDFIIKGVVTVTGELKLVITLEGAQGIEYKKGKVRYINSKGVDVDFVAEGKIEATLSPGFAITILGKWQIGEILLDLGAGLSVSFTAHLFDAEGHCLYTEGGTTLSAESIEELETVKSTISSEELLEFAKTEGGDWKSYEKGASVEVLRGVCFDWKIYPIIRLSMGEGLLPNILRDLGVELTYTFLGEKNVVLNGHLDFGANRKSAAFLTGAVKSETFGVDMSKTLGVGEKCSFDYKPWDSIVEEKPLDEEPELEESDILTTEGITLSTFRIFLNPGEVEYITITGLPEGYTLNDVKAKSDDEDIATIDVKYGKIQAKEKAGTTQIKIYTEDEKYNTLCAVTVSDDYTVEFEELKGQ